MDIKTKNSGKSFYQVSSDLAAVLLELGLVERIEKPVPPRVTEPEWGIGRTISGRVCITLRLPSGEVRNYDGYPDEAANAFRYSQWSSELQGYVVDGPYTPAAIVELYKAQYQARLP